MNMKRTFASIVVIAFSSLGFAQTAQEKAAADLVQARTDYEGLSNSIATDEAKLVREVEGLDDQVLKLSKEYSKLNREQDLRTSKKAQLATELEKRQIEFDYNKSIFERYFRETQNKVQVSEFQALKEEFATYEADLKVAGDDVVKKMAVSLPFLEDGIDRILARAGGHEFAGKAQSDDAIVVPGKFAIVGPLGFFASNDSSLAGVTNDLSGDVEFPSIQVDESGNVAGLIANKKADIAVDGSLGKAYKLEKAQKGLKEYLEGGGIVGYVISGLGLFALIVAILKAVEIYVFHVPRRKTINEFLDAKLSGNHNEARAISAQIPGLSGKLVETGEQYFFSKRRILEDALFEKFSAIPPRLERGLPFLSLVAASAPMLGLLGTVLGIMKTFALMSEGGSSNIKFISGGISEALITTFMGLTVAIPILLLHGFLKGMAKGKAGDAEGVAMAIINGTSEITKQTPRVDEEPDLEDQVA